MTAASRLADSFMPLSIVVEDVDNCALTDYYYQLMILLRFLTKGRNHFCAISLSSVQ